MYKTFKERYLADECAMSVINDYAAMWRKLRGPDGALKKYLGLTDEEFKTWLEGGDEALARLLNAGKRTQYLTYYLEWDKLTKQLQELVNSLLGPRFTVSIERSDFYYWDMELHTDMEISEELSEEICDKLDLRDIDVLHFLDDNEVCQSQAVGLLEKLTHHEVTSSHADDNGVWIICKALRASSEDYSRRMIDQCERRLRKEIRSKHYPTVNRDTACHQLFGFMEALKGLGMVNDSRVFVRPDHFSDVEENTAPPTIL